jgi:hypothetical protein
MYRNSLNKQGMLLLCMFAKEFILPNHQKIIQLLKKEMAICATAWSKEGDEEEYVIEDDDSL